MGFRIKPVEVFYCIVLWIAFGAALLLCFGKWKMVDMYVLALCATAVLISFLLRKLSAWSANKIDTYDNDGDEGEG